MEKCMEWECTSTLRAVNIMENGLRVRSRGLGVFVGGKVNGKVISMRATTELTVEKGKVSISTIVETSIMGNG